MNYEFVLLITAVVLLLVLMVMLALKKQKFGTNDILQLLKRTNAEQTDSVAKQVANVSSTLIQGFDTIRTGSENAAMRQRDELNRRFADIQAILEQKMETLQKSNEKRLEQIQGVVDEKLQKTLETRLTQSFELVSKQLDSVQQGLGEMKNLAADAKSLKNALINVKERGTYGEVRLEKLLADILAPAQYEMNVEIANGKRVEFAVKLPGNGDTALLLPIDSKFPIEDYTRLLDADDKESIQMARAALFTRIKSEAKDIHDKYIVPPKTTDFALLFLPTEGLYAEVVQNVGLFEELRDKYKVTAVGATTLSAFLSSLQMGFKTLAIEQRSQEVWDTLRTVKAEFIKFGGVLEQAHKQIQTVDNTLEKLVRARTKKINKALNTVSEFGGAENAMLPENVDDEEDAEE